MNGTLPSDFGDYMTSLTAIQLGDALETNCVCLAKCMSDEACINMTMILNDLNLLASLQ